jgi:hypothetical protein
MQSRRRFDMDIELLETEILALSDGLASEALSMPAQLTHPKPSWRRGYGSVLVHTTYVRGA